MALLEFLLAAARARVVAADVLQGVAHRLLVAVVAVRAVHMAMVVIVVMIVTVVAVWAMDMGLLGHCRVTPVGNHRGLSHHCATSAGPDG
ncbi:hypothetical protein KU43P_41930 [Pseudomonas sp. KU43P]|nr:hypothetical protein KU43P_41930 [Pseudomonas sp. KU43P]